MAVCRHVLPEAREGVFQARISAIKAGLLPLRSLEVRDDSFPSNPTHMTGTTPSLLRIIFLLVAIFLVSNVPAADVYWSPNDNFQTGGSGTWSTSVTDWSTDGAAFVGWRNDSSSTTGDNAVFAGADGTYAITVGSAISARSIVFTANGYTLSASSARTISLATNISSLSVASGKTAYVGNNVTISVGGNSGLTGGGTLVIQSGGRLTINAAISTNGNSNAIIDGGIVTAQNWQLGGTGNTGNSLTIKNGGTLTATGLYGIRYEKGGTNVVNLDGGVLSTTRVVNSGGTANVNFNGGTLKVYNDSQTSLGNSFLSTSNAFVKEGGAIFDTNGYNVFSAQALLHGGAAGTDGGLTKNGAGSLSLNGASTYTGATIVNQGTLIINGSLSADSDVTVNSGATLGGSGSVSGAVNVKSGGSLSPGNSPGVATYTDALTFETGSAFKFELIANTDAGRGTSYDGVNLSGVNSLLTIQSGVRADLIFNASGSTVEWSNAFWRADHSWLIFDNVNAPTLASSAVFDVINVSSDSSGMTTTGSFSFSQNAGGDIYLNYVAVPEPSITLLLSAAGMGMCLMCRRGFNFAPNRSEGGQRGRHVE